jgi:hypothetical protein
MELQNKIEPNHRHHCGQTEGEIAKLRAEIEQEREMIQQLQQEGGAHH